LSTNEAVLQSLRSATHAAHVRINHHPFLAGLTKPGYPMEKYRSLLATYFHIYGSVERQIDGFASANAVAFTYGTARKKLPWLEADLHCLGMDPQGAAVADPPGKPAADGATVGAFQDIGALIGTLYAIEGATLGGQVISRHVQATLGLTASTGARFFNGYGDTLSTQQQWQEFCQFANSIADRPQLVLSAQLAAVRMFELIESQLDALHVRLIH
jgi:heme oxygenase